MMGPGHRVFGALAGATYAHLSGEEFAVVGLVAIAASASSHGWSSPDVDQTKPWTMLARILPAGWLAHRTGLSHWWGWPALAWLLLLPRAPEDVHMLAAALLIGWSSHILADAIFGGKVGGVSLLPAGGPRIGLPFQTGEMFEDIARNLFSIGLAVVLWDSLARSWTWRPDPGQAWAATLAVLPG